MKNFKNFLTIGSTSMLALPFVAGAQTLDSGGTFSAFLASVLGFINTVLIPFILGVAFLFFVWGIFQFFIVGGSNDEAKEKGKSLITYAILGFVIILVFWGVINLLVGATGLTGATVPSTPATFVIPATP